MTKLLISFSDEAELLDAWAHLRASEPALPEAVVLLYAAAPRPARIKRWVSRGGWERLALERARRSAARLTAELAGLGTAVEFQVAFGPIAAAATELMRLDMSIERHVDAARPNAPRQAVPAAARPRASASAHGPAADAVGAATPGVAAVGGTAGSRTETAVPAGARASHANAGQPTTIVRFARKRLALGSI